jgi:hypothetical protein
MTPEQWRTIRHFGSAECKRPEAMDYEFVMFLDDWRDAYGKPLTITNDARTIPEELAQPVHAEPPESGLHVFDPTTGLWCRAVDLRWLASRTDMDALVRAYYQVKGDRPGELELVPFGPNAHIHAGLFRDPGHESRLEFSAA